MKRWWLVLALLLFVLGEIGVWFFNNGTPQNQKLPAGYPEMPIFAQMKLVSANQSITPKGNSYQGVWRVDKGVPEATDWYIKTLKSSGWIIDTLPANTPGGTVSYLVAKKAGVVLQLSVVGKSGEGTEITADFPVNYGSNDE